MKIPFYKKAFSYLLPITLEKTIGNNSTVLLVQLYLNEFMLATPRAIYSFGLRYAPFTKTFKILKNELPKINSFLLLGTGLGSALYILQKKYHVYPNAVLVDNDEDVLKFSIQYMPLNSLQNVEWKCMDATHYLNTTSMKFDLIGVDIFKDLIAPSFVSSKSFIAQCKNTLNPNGLCIFNMILADDDQIASVDKQLKKEFSKVDFILDKVNTYFICRT